MQKGIGGLLVYQRQMGRSAEETQGTFDAIGRAIYSGVGRGLKSVGIELSVLQQQALKMDATVGDYAANVAMLNREMQRQHGGAMREWMSTLPGQAEGA